MHANKFLCGNAKPSQQNILKTSLHPLSGWDYWAQNTIRKVVYPYFLRRTYQNYEIITSVGMKKRDRMCFHSAVMCITLTGT